MTVWQTGCMVEAGTQKTASHRGVEKSKRQRGRDAAATQADIARAAAVRFARRGYSNVTLQEIADDIGVTPALINRYFVSKRALFDLVVSTKGEISVTAEPEELAAATIAFWQDEQESASALALVRSIDLDGGLGMRRELRRRVREPILGVVSSDEDASAKVRMVESLIMGVGLFGMGRLTGDTEPSPDEVDAMLERFTRMIEVCLAD
ncbi:hypothetical protein CH272_28050 [Rhodococcus sp. 05-340-1]|nr:hypothetical protein CH271_10770 [Rhodococcus sp. 05-340-2]OZD69339.1 hypothetical protein CH272_28050 [Rhodococcus sp. 05-340-1]